MKILIAIDGSPFTRKALAYVATHPDMFGAASNWVLVNVGIHLPANVTRRVGKDVIESYHAEEAAKVLEPVEAYLHELHVTGYAVELRQGYAPEEIVAAAKEAGAELIVMGTHGLGMFGRALLGSVATKVVAESPVPVLLVK